MSMPYMKDGAMNRDPHKPMAMKVWKRGAKQTIQKGPEHSPAMSDGMHGRKMNRGMKK